MPVLHRFLGVVGEVEVAGALLRRGPVGAKLIMVAIFLGFALGDFVSM